MFIGKSKKAPKVFAKLFLLIIILALGSFIAMSAALTKSESPTQALTSTSTTMLSSGNGLVYGDNQLRLTGVTAINLSNSEADAGAQADASITQTSAHDFYISGQISVNRSPKTPWPSENTVASASAYFKNEGNELVFASYPQTELGDINLSSIIGISPSLTAAIKDPMLTVTANAYYFASASTGDAADVCDVTLTWMPEGNPSDSNNTSKTVTGQNLNNTIRNTGAIALNTIGADGAIKLDFNNFKQQSLAYATVTDWFTTERCVSSAIGVRFSQIYIKIDIAMNNGLQFRTAAANFGDITIVDGPNRDANCARDFLKPMDVFEIKTNLRYQNENLIMSYDGATADKFFVTMEEQGITLKNEFRNFFFKEGGGANLMQVSTIEWNYDSMYLERVIDEHFDVTGQVARFRVLDIPPGVITSLELQPFLRKFEEGYSIGLNRIGHKVNLRGDASAPEDPEINESDPFLTDYFNVQKWYSKGFQEGSPATRGVYIKVQMSPASFITGNGSTQRMYYTTDGQNPTTSSTRKVLVDNITINSTNRDVTLFFPMPGSERQKIYTLRIVAYDYVGNISSVVTYSNIKIDCTDYFLEVFFTLGDRLSAAANTSAVTMLGTSELGIYKSETDKDFKKTASRPYRRGDLAYLQLSVKKSSQYRLFQYYNSGKRAYVCTFVDYGDFASGNYGHFTEKTNTEVKLSVPDFSQQVAIVLTDEFLEDMENLKFYFVYKQQLPITLGATETVYDGTPKGIEQPTTTYSGIEILTYYKQTAEQPFDSQSLFTNAGAYFYKCEIIDVNYFGYASGAFTIKKADPFVTGLEVESIYYENAMSSAIIRCSNTDPENPDTLYSSGSSSDGKVSGSFKIVYPVETTQAYLRPSVGSKDIAVTFSPNEQYANNYNVMTYNTTLFVHYSTNLQISFVESTFSYTFQRDVVRYASAITNPGNQQIIYEYKMQGQPDSAYTTKAPSDAGVYEVRVRTDLAICNYDNQKTTEGTDLKFIINRQPVLVMPTPAVCYYQNDFDPIAEAYLVTPFGNQYIPVSDWSYQYFVNNQWIDSRPINSGVYEVKVIVNSINEYGDITGNYIGEAVTTLTIKKGNADEANGDNYSINFPTVINNTTISGHLAYGQPLSQINLAKSDGYVAKYKYRVMNQDLESKEERVIAGEFILATRPHNAAIETVAAFVAEMKATVLEAGRYTGSTAPYVTFVPEDLINFNIATWRTNINVVKGTPTFNNLQVSELTYGQIAAELTIEGFDKVPGDLPQYIIAEIKEIDGVVINPVVNGLAITGRLEYIDTKGKQMRAGTQSVVFRFVPDDEDNIRIVTALNINVIINKAAAEIETNTDLSEVDEEGFIKKTYGNVFRNPAVRIFKNIGGSRVEDNSFNVIYTYKNSQNSVVAMNAFTAAGQYTMTVQIDNPDYQGLFEQTLTIQKARPSLNTAPLSSSVEYMMDMSGVNLSGGKMQHPVTYQQVTGTFSFKDGVPPPPDGVGDRPYAITFTPTDSTNYESTDITITINIKKAKSSITLSNLEHTYSGVAKNPTYLTGIVKRTDGDSWYYVDLGLPGNELTPLDRPLNVEIVFNTYNNVVPVNAGKYQVTARINDANYEGMIQEEYVINQANATIIIDNTSRVQAYNSGIISLRATAQDLSGNVIKVLIAQTFSTNANVALADAPRDVGIYNVILEIRDTNYKAKTAGTLTITISQLNIVNNLQTYGTRPPVIVEYLPSTASSTVRYQPIFEDELGDITDVQPTGAGMYKILINFPANLNNGYSASFEDSTLIINKAQVSLSYNGDFKYTYTGLPRAQLTMDINSVKVIPSALYSLKRGVRFFDAAVEEFTAVEPVDVGSYLMVVTIEDNNYTGTAEFTYTIEKAAPVIRINPAVSPLIYTDDGNDAVFVGGEVIFNGEIKTGSYRLVENTMNLEVGVHNVMYKFTPTDSHNLKEIHGTAQVTIVQKDLSSEIVFYGATTVQYNQQPHAINAYIDSGENVLIDIFYNRSKSAPRERGEYVITAEISDKNYKGSAEWASRLTIIVGMPVISAPKLTDIRINDPLGYSEIQGGFAYIKGTGEFIGGKLVTGTATLIAGTFAFTRPTTVMTQANYREVELSFKPFASNNFSNVIFTATVRVIGQDPVIGAVQSTVKEAGKTIYYGQDLTNYNLYFANTPAGATPGVLNFVDEGILPEVGKPVKYRFYPENDSVYNIVEGEVNVTISKTTPSVQSVTVKAFYGQTLRDAIFNAVMLNQHNSAVAVNGQFSLISVDGYTDLDTILTVKETVSMTGMSTLSATPTLSGRYRFVSQNYNTVEGDVTISCFNQVNETNIEIERSEKRYDALPIGVSDIGITTAFTLHPLFEENYFLTVLNEAGELVDGAEVGIYTVIIEIIDVMYYGKKTVTFIVDKADISEDITLSHTSGIYGDAISKPNVILSGNYGNIPQNNFTIEFKGINEDISGYNETMPSQAGYYDARVTVTNNAYFAGQKLLTFRIEKKAATVTVSGMIQNFGSVNPLVPQTVEFDLVPTITYYSATYNRSPIVPTEAGDYTARIEILNNNYTIRAGNYAYVEVSFKVLQANLTLRERPTVSDIVYSQSYKDAKMNGGKVTYGESLEALGKYVFMTPTQQPDAGRQTTSLLFTPYNKNFAPLRIDNVEVTVLRANAEILFTNLMSVFDGTNKKNEVTYVSDSQVEWEITFIRQGIEVNPINAGSYEIRVKVLSDNHQLGIDLKGAPVLEKSNVATFIITKASMDSFTLPKPTDIGYGQSLAFSTLNSSPYEGFGMASYAGIEGYVGGSFSYVNAGLVLGDAGTYFVDIVFTPTDSANHNIFYTKIEVDVSPAIATISVKNVTYIYGTPITLPIFTTNPGNLTVSHDMDCLGQIIAAGSYKYRVWVTAKNFDHPDNYFEFNITVLKKEVRLEFVQNGQRIEKYYTTYKKSLDAIALVNEADIVEGDLFSPMGVHINQAIVLNYFSIPKSDDEKIVDHGKNPPANIGDYRVTAVIQHDNYYGSAVINYDINLGEIEDIRFDSKTLERQIYGEQVVPPIITTKPSGVAYWIDYQGYGKTLPPNAGTYNIVVYFNDPNYAPRHISAMFKIQKREITLENIEVQNKIFDGVETISIVAKMKGVSLGDEVKLDIRARTAGGVTNVGTHKIEITSYTISGLSAQNYSVAKPYFAGTVEIYEKKIIDNKSQSFITTNEGFTSGLSVEFKEIDSESNKENIFTNLLGQKATVQSFIIKENGQPRTLDAKVKVYLKIPDEYLNVKNLNVVGLGDLGDRQINFIREGEYYTFYTDSSGEVAFSSNDFSYWIIPVVALVVIMVLGVIVLFWLNPRRRKGATGDIRGWRATTQKIKKGGLYKD